MSTASGNITVMIINDSSANSRSIKFSALTYRIIKLLAILFVLALFFVGITYAGLLSHSRERTRLLAENEQLRTYNAKVIQLEQELKANRILLKKMATLAGIDLEEYDLNISNSSGTLGVFRSIGSGMTVPVVDSLPHPNPNGVPVAGWISRDFRPKDENPKLRHFGLDLAVGSGTPVVATANGVVSFVGWDETFGNQVIIQHENGVETIYGHNESLFVEVGQKVLYGEVIALSGNTGISTAPHLHYEIRKNGKPINPEAYYVDKE